MTAGLELPLLTLALLVLASFLAGWIDAVVGGGGLIQLPALLIGLPPDTPVATIAGTNKLPSFMGTLTASLTYLRTIKVDWGLAWPLLVAAAIGSWTGAQITHFRPRHHFTPLVLPQIEEFGFCGRGEAKDFIKDGNIEIGGRLPVNTHGGLIGEAYLHGMNGIAEGVRLTRGVSCNQPKQLENVLVTAASAVPTSALILSRDR